MESKNNYKYFGIREIGCPKCGYPIIKINLVYDQEGNLLEEIGICGDCKEVVYTKPLTDESEIEPGFISSISDPSEQFNKPSSDPFKPTVKCPYCGSTSTKKISTLSRLGSFATFGFAGKKVGKQWHCNNCKSDF